ncbi:hypothetical protein GWK08_11715 [Leptobacterium flavescens]|uniref:Lipocalin-like domain-containing protein n=1 Tax=Leptobacterium flavescens TaxID=472055 RepID=A0A6P0UL74_9FLAO|nr:hypothetical protein [Leptobacterium flavescens]NER14111.1 hypothetical protein [Leptobacterium flavescens]
MKTALYLFALILVLGSFSERDRQKYTLDGTWELIDQYTYDGTHVTDTIPNNDGYRQIKMYNSGRVMWTRFVPKDSVDWFGYGSYSNTDSTLTETLEYGSASMMKIIDSMRVFKFELHLEKEFFQQITVDEEGHKIFSENYRRLH